MTAEVAAIRAGVALAIGAVIIGCGSAVQTPATVDRPSVSVVADGVSVRLTLERDATSPALPLEAIVVVDNVGSGEQLAQAGCPAGAWSTVVGPSSSTTASAAAS